MVVDDQPNWPWGAQQRPERGRVIEACLKKGMPEDYRPTRVRRAETPNMWRVVVSWIHDPTVRTEYWLDSIDMWPEKGPFSLRSF